MPAQEDSKTSTMEGSPHDPYRHLLTHVLIQNYKSIGKCDIQLGPLTFLAGSRFPTLPRAANIATARGKATFSMRSDSKGTDKSKRFRFCSGAWLKPFCPMSRFGPYPKRLSTCAARMPYKRVSFSVYGYMIDN